MKEEAIKKLYEELEMLIEGYQQDFGKVLWDEMFANFHNKLAVKVECNEIDEQYDYYKKGEELIRNCIVIDYMESKGWKKNGLEQWDKQKRE